MELLKVVNAFDDINTIYKFDIVRLNSISNQKFYDAIMKDGITIFPV